MSEILVESPYQYLTDRAGRTLINGQIYIGQPGQDPENFPQNAFFDVDGTIPAPQPIATNSAGFPCDVNGNPQRIFTGGPYSIRIRDENGVQVVYAQDSTDGFFGVSSNDLANQTNIALGSGLVGYLYKTGWTGTTLHDKIARSWVDIKDAGAIGDGVANDKAAFDLAASEGRAVLLPAGTYNVPSGDYSAVRFYSFDGATCNNATVAIVDPLANSIAVGTCAPFQCTESALPFGWVALNGQVLNRTVYPALWSFANNSGVIVDEVDKATNPMAFGRGNGTTTFSLPDMRAVNAAGADLDKGLDATFIAGKVVTVTAATAAPGISVRSGVFSVWAIRAFASAVNQGTIDIQALQTELNALENRSLTRAVDQTLAGTAVDFLGIPTGTRRITIMLSDASTNGTSPIQIQIGTSLGIEATTYIGSTSNGNTGVATAAMSTGFQIVESTAATNFVYGNAILTNIRGNTWVISGNTGGSGTARFSNFGGAKSLAGVLDRIRITTVGGTNVFDSGTINIMYEG